MAKGKKVSGKTHTKAQLDNYANQNNPNNKAYKANQKNRHNQKKYKNEYVEYSPDYGFGWCDD